MGAGGVPAFGLAFEGAAATFWQSTFAVGADLGVQLCLLLLPVLPVTADQGADVLVCGIWLTAASPSNAQVVELLALPF